MPLDETMFYVTFPPFIFFRAQTKFKHYNSYHQLFLSSKGVEKNKNQEIKKCCIGLKNLYLITKYSKN
jgi:hypothetical protein